MVHPASTQRSNHRPHGTASWHARKSSVTAAMASTTSSTDGTDVDATCQHLSARVSTRSTDGTNATFPQRATRNDGFGTRATATATASVPS